MLRHRRTGVIILAILALLGGLVTGRDLFFNITYLLGLLILLSFGWAWSNINWVYISRTTRTRRTQVGRPLEERFSVRNTSVLPKLWIEVRDYSTLPHHYASKVVNALGSRSAITWRANTICRRSGRYQLGPIELNSSDPFGLFPMTRYLTPTTNVVIYPMTVDIQQFALPVGVLPGGDALRRRTHYVTTNASGVRDYAPGDSFSRIHWRSSARRDRLIVKEFELDPLADIWIVPDMAEFAHVSSEGEQSTADLEPGEIPVWMRAAKDEQYILPDMTEEYTVTIAASLAQYFLRRDRSVGMMAYGQSREIVQPDRGERQISRLLETLAVLRAEGQVAIQDALNAEMHLFPRGTTLIVVTPTTNEAWLAAARQLTRRGLRVVAVMVDPASFGGRRSAASIASLLQASNIVTYTVNCGDNLEVALSGGKLKAGTYALTR
jgi:uncharacterized protein (DUF58 family)